jgi:hypothetical protein
MWMIANMVLFRVEYLRTTNLREYTNFMRERKRQLYLRKDRRRLLANYLCVVEQPEEKTQPPMRTCSTGQHGRISPTSDLKPVIPKSEWQKHG